MTTGRAVGAKGYRVPRETLSLVVTLVSLLAAYFLVLLFFFEDLMQSWKTQAITLGSLGLYLLLVLFQQRSALGTLVRVGERQFPEIHRIAVQAAERLGVAPVPIYIKRSSDQNIYTLGVFGRKIFVLHSAMADAMTPENLQFFIGREIGHTQAGHAFLRALLKPVGSDAPLVGKFLNSVIFGDWWKRAEGTADRAGLIACGSITSAVTALLKFGVGVRLFEQMDIREFLEQIKDVRSVGGRVAEIVTVQPYLTNRIRALVRFGLSEQFGSIAAQEHAQSEILLALPQTYIQSQAVRPSAPKAESAPGPPQARFVLVTADGRTYPVQPILTRIGRSPDNEVPIDNDRVSRYHAEIQRAGEGFILTDKGSRNGVWVNGTRVSSAVPLRPGDKIGLAEVELTFTSPSR